MALFSASSFERVALCPASAVLPQVAREGGAAVEKGNHVHAFKAALAEGVAHEVALAAVPAEWRDLCAALDAPAPGTLAEVAFAVNARTGAVRVLGTNIGREYTLEQGEIAGTADTVVPAEVLVVGDYKTGRGEVTAAARNKQLAFLAYAAATVYKRDEAIVEIVKIGPSGYETTDSAHLDALDLQAARALIRDTHQRVVDAQQEIKRGRQPALREGSHCTWCPARLACPARTALVRRLAEPEALATSFAAALSPHTAARAHELLSRAEDVVRDLRAQLVMFAQEFPIDLGDGRTYGPVECEREAVTGSVAHAVLERLHGREVADAACELSTSKAAIERALKKVAERGQLAGLRRQALDEIEVCGGVELKRSVQVKEHTQHTEVNSGVR